VNLYVTKAGAIQINWRRTENQYIGNNGDPRSGVGQEHNFITSVY